MAHLPAPQAENTEADQRADDGILFHHFVDESHDLVPVEVLHAGEAQNRDHDGCGSDDGEVSFHALPFLRLRSRKMFPRE